MTIGVQEWCSAARKFTFGEHSIACWLGGNAKQRPLLLIHGFPTASHDWAKVWDALGQDRALIAADMLGFGLSDKPKDGYSIYLQADLQQALIGHLGIAEYDILAHDYGVSVAQEMLSRQQHGDRDAQGIGKVMFLNGGLFPDQHRARRIQTLGAGPMGPLVSAAMNRQRFGKSFSEVFGPRSKPTDKELDDFWWFITRKRGHRRFHKLLHYIEDRRQNTERWTEALRNVPARVSYLNGAEDPVSGRHSYEAWRARIPEAKAELLPGIGHYPQWEAPDAVVEKVREWLG